MWCVLVSDKDVQLGLKNVFVMVVFFFNFENVMSKVFVFNVWCFVKEFGNKVCVVFKYKVILGSQNFI